MRFGERDNLTMQIAAIERIVPTNVVGDFSMPAQHDLQCCGEVDHRSRCPPDPVLKIFSRVSRRAFGCFDVGAQGIQTQIA